MFPLATRAPAKINLTLHVLGRRCDGWHDLESLVAFAGAGDDLWLEPGPKLSLHVMGSTAAEAGELSQNLILRAAQELSRFINGLIVGHFHLTKRLPVAAGIGGGSSDAAAALRLLARANNLSIEDPRVLHAARSTGADVPVCLIPRARMMTGAGEMLGPALKLPCIFAILVNPGVRLETARVFAKMGLHAGDTLDRAPHPRIMNDMTREALFRALGSSRNDMEYSAGALSPCVPAVLAELAAVRDCRLTRMSGSGATCFALFEDRGAVARAAHALQRDHPGWWIKPTILR